MPALIAITGAVAVLLAVLAGSSWLILMTNQGILSQPGLAQITVTPGNALTFTNEQVQWMQSLKHVQAGYPILMGDFPATIGADGTVFQMGNLPATADMPTLVAGTWPDDNQVVLPDQGLLSRETGAAINARALIGSTVTLTIPMAQGFGPSKTWSVVVVGEYRWSDSQGIERTVYTPLTTLQSILVAQGSWTGTTSPTGSAGFGVYIVDADNPRNVADIASQLEARGLRTQYVEQTVHGLSMRIQSIQIAAGALVVLIGAFAALSISNTLVQAVRLRRREIGVLLALGFTPRWIGASIAAEACLGGLASLGLGLLVAESIIVVLGATQPTLNLHIDPASVLMVGAGTLAFCLGASWLPARQAARVDPVSVLREE